MDPEADLDHPPRIRRTVEADAAHDLLTHSLYDPTNEPLVSGCVFPHLGNAPVKRTAVVVHQDAMGIGVEAPFVDLIVLRVFEEIDESRRRDVMQYEARSDDRRLRLWHDCHVSKVTRVRRSDLEERTRSSLRARNPWCSRERRRYIGNVASGESCEQCGFEWDGVSANEISERLGTSTDAFVETIKEAGSRSCVRPSLERWSILEYGAHLRDVLISIRERIITASIIDEPTGTPIHRNERVALGFYALDSASDVIKELTVSSQLFVRTIRSLPPTYEQREFFFSPVTPRKVTILWAGAQALHECEHHLLDVRENLSLLDVTPT
jgi:hypothetical protein